MKDPRLGCCYFRTDEEVKAAVSNWFRTQPAEFYAKGIDNLIWSRDTCVAEEEGCEKIKSIFLLPININLSYYKILITHWLIPVCTYFS